MAMALCNLRQPGSAISAGTVVEEPGQRLEERPGNDATFAVMREVGIDITQNTRRLVSEELVNSADQVVVLAEPETWPEFLRDNSKVEAWIV